MPGARRPQLRGWLDHPAMRTAWVDQGSAGRLVDWTTQFLGREPTAVRNDSPQSRSSTAREPTS
ncbi:hypothetical protein ACHBTE_34815 [Streptomyces sp. M41]|uniref:hypothetical protein n=1 Tax=Streptomyces sp. M41 TaxID=3059412 RepID=UPI00374DC299